MTKISSFRLYISVFASIFLLFSCGTTKRAAKTEGLAELIKWSEMYPQSALPIFYYSEGLKNDLIGGDSKESAAMFAKAIEADSTHAPSLYQMAELSTVDDGLRYVGKAYHCDTTNVWYLSLLGRLLIADNQYDSAMTVFSSLMTLSPDNPGNYMLLAALSEQQGSKSYAVAILDSAERVFGTLPQLSEYKRQLLIDMNLHQWAVDQTIEMIDNFPYDHSNYIVLAELYAAMGKDSLVVDAYQKSLEVNPENLDALISMSEYYKTKDDNIGFLSVSERIFLSDDMDMRSKIEMFEGITRSKDYYRSYYPQINRLAMALLTKYPTNKEATILYADHLMASGNLDGGLEFYKSMLKDPEAGIDIYDNILGVESYLQRADSVNKYMNLAIEKFPNNADLHLRNGSAKAYYLNDYKGAQIEYQKALKLADSDSMISVIYCVLGDNSNAVNSYRQAYKYYAKGLKYDPQNSMLLNNYAYCLSETGVRLEQAQEMSALSNNLTGNSNATYLDTQGWILYKLGRYEEAATIMRKAIGLDSSSNKELFFHYAEILAAKGDEFMAKIYWRRALERGYDADVINQRLNKTEQK